MQENDGTFTQLDETAVGNLKSWQQGKVIRVDQIFRIKRCYFQITDLNKEGMVAKGISRERYYELKRGRPDLC